MTMDQATKRQLDAVETLHREILQHDGLRDDDYEYKRFEFEERGFTKHNGRYHPLVFLHSEVGLKNDENTMAAILARRHRHIMIGPRGKLRLLNSRGGKKVEGRAVLYELTDD